MSQLDRLLFDTRRRTYADARLSVAVRRVLELHFKGTYSGFHIQCAMCKRMEVTTESEPVFLTGVVDLSHTHPVVHAQLHPNLPFRCQACRPAAEPVGGGTPTPPAPQLFGEPVATAQRSPAIARQNSAAGGLPPTSARTRSHAAAANMAEAAAILSTLAAGLISEPAQPPNLVINMQTSPEADATVGDSSAAQGSKPREGPQVHAGKANDSSRSTEGSNAAVAAEPDEDVATTAQPQLQQGQAEPKVLYIEELHEALCGQVQGRTARSAKIDVGHVRYYLLALRRPTKGAAAPDPASTTELQMSESEQQTLQPADQEPTRVDSAAVAAAWAAAHSDQLSAADAGRLRQLEFAPSGPAVKTLSHVLMAVADWVLELQSLNLSPGDAGFSCGPGAPLLVRLRPWAFAARANDSLQLYGSRVRPSLHCLGGSRLGKPPTCLLELLNAPPNKFSLATEVLEPEAPGFTANAGCVLPMQRLAALLKRRNKRTKHGPWGMGIARLQEGVKDLLVGDAIYTPSTRRGGSVAGGRGSAGSEPRAPVDAFMQDLGATAIQVLEVLALPDIDGNVGFCAQCGEIGNMVACDACVDSFCTDCLGGVNPDDLPDPWNCRYCTAVLDVSNAVSSPAHTVRLTAAQLLKMKTEPAISDDDVREVKREEEDYGRGLEHEGNAISDGETLSDHDDDEGLETGKEEGQVQQQAAQVSGGARGPSAAEQPRRIGSVQGNGTQGAASNMEDMRQAAGGTHDGSRVDMSGPLRDQVDRSRKRLRRQTLAGPVIERPAKQPMAGWTSRTLGPDQAGKKAADVGQLLGSRRSSAPVLLPNRSEVVGAASRVDPRVQRDANGDVHGGAYGDVGWAAGGRRSGGAAAGKEVLDEDTDRSPMEVDGGLPAQPSDLDYNDQEPAAAEGQRRKPHGRSQYVLLDSEDSDNGNDAVNDDYEGSENEAHPNKRARRQQRQEEHASPKAVTTPAGMFRNVASPARGEASGPPGNRSRGDGGGNTRGLSGSHAAGGRAASAATPARNRASGYASPAVARATSAGHAAAAAAAGRDTATQHKSPHNHPADVDNTEEEGASDDVEFVQEVDAQGKNPSARGRRGRGRGRSRSTGGRGRRGRGRGRGRYRQLNPRRMTLRRRPSDSVSWTDMDDETDGDEEPGQEQQDVHAGATDQDGLGRGMPMSPQDAYAQRSGRGAGLGDAAGLNSPGRGARGQRGGLSPYATRGAGAGAGAALAQGEEDLAAAGLNAGAGAVRGSPFIKPTTGGAADVLGEDEVAAADTIRQLARNLEAANGHGSPAPRGHRRAAANTGAPAGPVDGGGAVPAAGGVQGLSGGVTTAPSAGTEREPGPPSSVLGPEPGPSKLPLAATLDSQVAAARPSRVLSVSTASGSRGGTVPPESALFSQREAAKAVFRILETATEVGLDPDVVDSWMKVMDGVIAHYNTEPEYAKLLTPCLRGMLLPTGVRGEMLRRSTNIFRNLMPEVQPSTVSPQ